MMKKILLLTLSSLLLQFGYGQFLCGTDLKTEELLSTDQKFAQDMEEMEQMWMDYIHNKENNASRPVLEGTDTIFEIPVVVHVIHTGGAVGSNYNKSDAAIESWIEYTNQMFEGTAPGYVGPGDGGARIPIRLVLAKRDPDCNATNGIVRIDGSSVSGYSSMGLRYSASTGASETSIRSLSRWDPNSYYNIYLVNKIDGEDGYSTSGSFIAGYAYLPPASITYDGSFMLSYIVGNSNTLGHEIGHAFGLYHTFQGGSSTDCPLTETDCTIQGDRVCDTEPNKYTFGPCPTNADINPCTGANYNGVQYNVMNYGQCPNRFTPGQAERVRFMTYLYRMSLVNSKGLDEPGTTVFSPIAACTPSGIANPSNPYNMGPCNVTFGDISYASNGYSFDDYEYYIDHTVKPCASYDWYTNLTLGDTIPLTVSIATNSQYIKVYIDYNNDGVFNETNEVILSTPSLSPDSYTYNIIIPSSGVVTGIPIRMRVIADFYSISSACSDRDFGQTEDFAVIFEEKPLAVSLVSFTVDNNNCQNEIKWEVQKPQELLFTEIERSVDGKEFKTIHKMATQQQYQYAYTDDFKNENTVYYRLRLTESSGNISYSKIMQVQNSCKEYWDVYPNPSDGQLSINYYTVEDINLNIRVVDINGRNLKSIPFKAQKGNNQFDFSIAELANGMYVIEIETESSINRKQIIKQ